MEPARWLSSPARSAIDRLVAGAALVTLSPVIITTGLLVKFRLGSPVLFRQQRAGRNGVPFHVVKFRTMNDGRGADGELLSDEERLPRFGRALRSTSLDELPQLWSVVRGDMSLIGPRPLPMAYVERYSAAQRRRLDATPGITGWAQVNGRNAIDWSRKLELDVQYVETASPLLDAKIVWLTVRSLMKRDGVSATGHATMPEFLGD